MRKFVEFNDVYKRYKMGEVTINAANGISFGIEEGEFAIVVGPSGAGKTTVLNILGGMSGCDEGQVFVGDKEVSSLSARELATYRRYDTGFVFQFYNLIPNLTVEENILLPVLLDGKSRRALQPRLDELLEIVGPTDRRKHTPRELSGGQQQRVAIARALVNDPEILFADEPTGNLDSKTGWEIMTLLQRINRERGVTILMVTHSADSAECGSRTVVVRDGRIV